MVIDRYMSPERIRNRPYSYMSDIWSFGLVMMECATGQYPFSEHANCIEVAQTILDADIPELPRNFSRNFRDFIKDCLHKDPERRIPAEILLESPWIQQHGVVSPEIAVENVYRWICNVTGGNPYK